MVERTRTPCRSCGQDHERKDGVIIRDSKPHPIDHGRQLAIAGRREVFLRGCVLTRSDSNQIEGKAFVRAAKRKVDAIALPAVADSDGKK